MMQLINRYKHYFISVFMHIVILSMFVLSFDALTKSNRLGNHQAKAVSAFIYQGDFSQSTSVKEKIKLTQRKQSEQNNTNALHALKIKSINHEQHRKQPASQQSSMSQGESTYTLIALLHDAIQRKQQYPASAWEMQRQGRATVGFYLYEDGHVSEVRVLKSSGTQSLDQAAIQAVNEAAPFHELLSYIKHPQEYQIDIVFELA